MLHVHIRFQFYFDLAVLCVLILLLLYSFLFMTNLYYTSSHLLVAFLIALKTASDWLTNDFDISLSA